MFLCVLFPFAFLEQLTLMKPDVLVLKYVDSPTRPLLYIENVHKLTAKSLVLKCLELLRFLRGDHGPQLICFLIEIGSDRNECPRAR